MKLSQFRRIIKEEVRKVLKEAEESFDSLMQMAQTVKGFKKYNNNKFEIQNGGKSNSVYQFERTSDPNKVKRTLTNDPFAGTSIVSLATVYNILWNATPASKGKQSGLPNMKNFKGIMVVDDEGESLQPLTDVKSAAELQQRLNREADVDMWSDWEFFGVVLGEDPKYDEEMGFNDLEVKKPLTYKQWTKELQSVFED